MGKGVALIVNVGGYPTGLAVDTATDSIYVANGNNDTLSIVNGQTCNAETTTGCAKVGSVATDGTDPIGVVVDEATRTVYAVNSSGSVAVINAQTCNALTSSGCSKSPTLVSVPGEPEFLALNAATNTLYIAGTGSGNEVAMIDGKTCNATSTKGCSAAPAEVDAGAGVFPIAADAATNTVYVGTNSGISVINGAVCDSATTSGCSKSPAQVSLGNEPAGVAVDDSTHTVYVSGESGTVGIFSSSTCNGTDTSGCNQSPRQVTVGQDPRGDFVDTATNTLYVTNAASDTISMLDLSTCNASVATSCSATQKSFPVGSSPRRVAVSSTGTLYVVNVLGNTLSLVNTASCNATTQKACPTGSSATGGGGGGGRGGGFGPPGLGAGGGGSGGSGPTNNSDCSPVTTNLAGTPATSFEANAIQVASGVTGGVSWSLWSAKGQSGANGLEQGGLVVNGHGYGLCPGYANPAETEMLDVGSHALVYGVIGYPGSAKIYLNEGTVGTFTRGAVLPTPDVKVVNGVAFFIGTLPKSACDYSALELDSTSKSWSAEHNLGFGSCSANSLSNITASQGVWQRPPGQFENNF